MSKGTLSHRKILAERFYQAANIHTPKSYLIRYLLERDFITWIKSRRNIDLDELSQIDFTEQVRAYLMNRETEIADFYDKIDVNYKTWKPL